ncbi:hypothetical protein [Extibacter sp. GGCC_0201]|uniref:hypothetical protein n=1 Tax=Extibacter sp. GGCC_0201 TaxID=2731209 RepID=UPI001AA165A9|nr:hypothetical protein [Extibacter sp. GGCC_0201]MBO1720718.1 hypothetical protein [Extibacter sp. GGCC_0201]
MPKPLFNKLVAICAIGFFCVLFGCVYGIHTKDKIFLLMSILIALCSLIRFISFYRLIHSHQYLCLEGICVKRDPALLKRSLHILLRTVDGTEYHFTLDKGVKLLQGHYYRLYFRTDRVGDARSADVPNALQEFLGFEELTSVNSKRTSEGQ